MHLNCVARRNTASARLLFLTNTLILSSIEHDRHFGKVFFLDKMRKMCQHNFHAFAILARVRWTHKITNTMTWTNDFSQVIYWIIWIVNQPNIILKIVLRFWHNRMSFRISIIIPIISEFKYMLARGLFCSKGICIHRHWTSAI